MKWLITGGHGMVATDLQNELAARGHDVVACSRDTCDITDSRKVRTLVADEKPDVIVNAAAYTKVDLAESEEAMANAVNGSAVEFLANAANAAGATLVQISTDFVFDGSKRTPYDVNHETNPLSVYGKSKLLGEFAASHAEKHVVVRTSWLFGLHGNNFVEAILGQVRKGTNPLRVVNDQRGRPTYTPHLAHAIIRVATLAHESDGARGVFHYADADDCTWFDFAKAIVEEAGAATEVVPVSSEEFPRPAKRPAYSVLSTERYERVTGVEPESWRDGLREYMAVRNG